MTPAKKKGKPLPKVKPRTTLGKDALDDEA